jgi:hypothetical protein
MSIARAVGELWRQSPSRPPGHAPPASAGRRARIAKRAAAGLAVAAGLVLGLNALPPAKRRAILAGGATGLAGVASVALAGLAAGLHRRRPR